MHSFRLFLLLLLLSRATPLEKTDQDDEQDDDDPASFHEEREEVLKQQIFMMTPEESIARFGAVRPLHPAPPRQNKVDHFVVLYMENHAADQIFGCMDLPGFDGIPKSGHVIDKFPGSGILGHINVSCGTSDYVCTSGPSYDTFSSKFAPLHETQAFKYPYGGKEAQNDKYSWIHGLEMGGSNQTAVKMFSPEQIPVKTAAARAFGVFNKLFTAVPGPSSPNHLFTQSGTSCGMRNNQLYDDCGGKNKTFPQRTIYDSMRLHNVSFSMFMNSTCGLDGKPCHGEDPITDDSPSAINTPDVAMEGVARYHDRFFSQEVFYAQAANGTLPQLSWVHPPLEACDHPCHDVAKGERLLKDVYEALRASPKWNKTVLFVAYDDAGGYYDHVVPPFEGVPADEASCNVQGKCKGDVLPFDFRRLGLRSSGMLISPLVAKGAVFQEPKGPTNTSQFELTSVSATIKNLFNLSSFLTKRDAWAGSFDELLLDEPRTDCPMHLPEAPKPAAPWGPPPGVSQESDDDDDETHAEQIKKRERLLNQRGPGHCSAWHGANDEVACAGRDHANLKQRRNLRLLSELTGQPLPDLDNMNVAQADVAMARVWSDWMDMQRKKSAAAIAAAEARNGEL
ncbi:hypothetical protein CYMTET_11592 [Cymbomonas tetramitiformis]|uniref:Phospholipase C n=1 Tax=Cymbomonas tetramitiformis TaxID=36881 RepID=A0AAE0GM83_9CHLO|nr:hypothetical protein CYMTET_11592 [Cymbomonas tetramitiformis]